MARFIGTNEEFNRYLGGKCRNDVNSSIKGYKKKKGKCEECGSMDVLEIAHCKSRLKIIEEILKKFKNEDGLISVDLEQFRKLFLDAHKPFEEKVKILCSKCHKKYDRGKKYDNDKANDASIKEEIKPIEDVEKDDSNISDQYLLEILYDPSDMDEFKELLLQYKSAVIRTFYENGEVKDQIWNASKFSETSDVKGNVRGRTEFRQGNWQRLKIKRVEVLIEYLPQNVKKTDVVDQKQISNIEPNTPKSSEPKLKHGEKQNDKQAVEYLERKIPTWFKHPEQKNAKILIQYLKLSDGGRKEVSYKEMTASGNRIPESMRQAREGADGFVFDYKKRDGYVKLWEPIKTFIIDEWNKHPELH